MTHPPDFTFNYPPMFTPHPTATAGSNSAIHPMYTLSSMHGCPPILGLAPTPTPSASDVDGIPMQLAQASVSQTAYTTGDFYPTARGTIVTPKSSVSRSSSMSTVSGTILVPESLAMTSISISHAQPRQSSSAMETMTSTGATLSPGSLPTPTQDQPSSAPWSYDALMIPDTTPKLGHHPSILPFHPYLPSHFVRSPAQSPRTIRLPSTHLVQPSGCERTATSASSALTASTKCTPKPFARAPIIAIPEHTCPPDAAAWWDRYMRNQSAPGPKAQISPPSMPRTRRHASVVFPKTAQKAMRDRSATRAVASAGGSRRGSLAAMAAPSRETGLDTVMSSPEEIIVQSQNGSGHGRRGTYPFYAGQLQATIQQSTYRPSVPLENPIELVEDVADRIHDPQASEVSVEARAASTGTL